MMQPAGGCSPFRVFFFGLNWWPNIMPLHGALLRINLSPCYFLFFFLQRSGVRAWASYNHASGASGLHKRFTYM
jgi:hypothetical protein